MDTIRTRKGRVVYDRKKHMWTAGDLERISKSFMEKNASEIPLRDYSRLISVVDAMSEYMLEGLLTPVGLARYGDEALEWMKYFVQNIVDLFYRDADVVIKPGARQGELWPAH